MLIFSSPKLPWKEVEDKDCVKITGIVCSIYDRVLYSRHSNVFTEWLIGISHFGSGWQEMETNVKLQFKWWEDMWSEAREEKTFNGCE